METDWFSCEHSWNEDPGLPARFEPPAALFTGVCFPPCEDEPWKSENKLPFSGPCQRWAPAYSVAVELTPPLGLAGPILNYPLVSVVMYLAAVALSVSCLCGNGPKDTLSLLWMEIVPSVAAEQRRETSSLALSDMSPMSPVSALTQL